MSPLLITQQQGKGFVYFLSCGSPNTLIEFTVQFGIELEEVQSLHMQPLMDKAGHEFLGSGIGNHAVHFRTQSGGVTQFIPFGQCKETGIRW